MTDCMTTEQRRNLVKLLYKELHTLLAIEEYLILKGDDCMLAQSTLDLGARIDTATTAIATKLAAGSGSGPSTAEVDAFLTPKVQALEALAGTPAPSGGSGV